MSAVYDGQTCVGSIEADNGHGVTARDAHGKRIGTYPTSTQAVSAVLRHARNPPPPAIERDADAELAAAVERFMKGGKQ